MQTLNCVSYEKNFLSKVLNLTEININHLFHTYFSTINNIKRRAMVAAIVINIILKKRNCLQLRGLEIFGHFLVFYCSILFELFLKQAKSAFNSQDWGGVTAGGSFLMLNSLIFKYHIHKNNTRTIQDSLKNSKK